MNATLTRTLWDLGVNQASARALWAFPAVDVAWACDRVDEAASARIVAAARSWNVEHDGLLLIEGWLAHRPSASYRHRVMVALAMWCLTDAIHRDVLPLARASARGTGVMALWPPPREGAVALREWRSVQHGTVPDVDAERHPDLRHAVPAVTVAFEPAIHDDAHGALLTPLFSGPRVSVRPSGMILGGGPSDDVQISDTVDVTGPQCRVWRERGRWYVQALSTANLLDGEAFGTRRLLGGEVLRLGRDVAFAFQLVRYAERERVA